VSDIEYVYVDQAPGVLASSRPVGAGDVIAAGELNLAAEHDRLLIERGALLSRPVAGELAATPAARPARRSTRKPKENR
jgi:hypothetical protein